MEIERWNEGGGARSYNDQQNVKSLTNGGGGGEERAYRKDLEIEINAKLEKKAKQKMD